MPSKEKKITLITSTSIFTGINLNQNTLEDHIEKSRAGPGFIFTQISDIHDHDSIVF